MTQPVLEKDPQTAVIAELPPSGPFPIGDRKAISPYYQEDRTLTADGGVPTSVLDVQLGKVCMSVIIHNYSGAFVYLPDADVFALPWTVNQVFSVASGFTKARARWEAPVGITQPAAANGQRVRFTYTEQDLDPSPGVPISVTPIATAATDATAASTPATPVVAEIEAFNGTTWDRVRDAQALDANAAIGILDQYVAEMVQNVQAATWTSWVRQGCAFYRNVSAVNTSQVQVFDLRSLVTSISILSVASAGTATLVVEVSVDNANWTTVDSIAAAATQTKVYGPTTVGATTAVAPLSFRYVRITAGTAGVGNTTTLTVSAK